MVHVERPLFSNKTRGARDLHGGGGDAAAAALRGGPLRRSGTADGFGCELIVWAAQSDDQTPTLQPADPALLESSRGGALTCICSPGAPPSTCRRSSTRMPSIAATSMTPWPAARRRSVPVCHADDLVAVSVLAGRRRGQLRDHREGRRGAAALGPSPPNVGGACWRWLV